MIDLDKIRSYIKWRRCTGYIATESGYPYLELIRFLNGKTAEPRMSNIKKLVDFIERDKAEFENVRGVLC